METKVSKVGWPPRALSHHKGKCWHDFINSLKLDHMKFIFLQRKNLKSDGLLNFWAAQLNQQSAQWPKTRSLTPKSLHFHSFTLSVSVSLTQIVIFLKFSSQANKIMGYTCLRVFAKCCRQVHGKAGSLQVIKTHSRMLHHQHHVADPLYFQSSHLLLHLTSS